MNGLGSLDGPVKSSFGGSIKGVEHWAVVNKIQSGREVEVFQNDECK